jgi:hypothetical protein
MTLLGLPLRKRSELYRNKSPIRHPQVRIPNPWHKFGDTQYVYHLRLTTRKYQEEHVVASKKKINRETEQ